MQIVSFGFRNFPCGEKCDTGKDRDKYEKQPVGIRRIYFAAVGHFYLFEAVQQHSGKLGKHRHRQIAEHIVDGGGKSVVGTAVEFLHGH